MTPKHRADLVHGASGDATLGPLLPAARLTYALVGAEVELVA